MGIDLSRAGDIKTARHAILLEFLHKDVYVDFSKQVKDVRGDSEIAAKKEFRNLLQ